MVVREPITVVVSEKGWIRALRGHQADLSGVAFKADDGPAFAFPAETTSKILVFASNGRFYTIDASKLPGGRGHGEPIRLYADIEQDGELVVGVSLSGRPQVPGREQVRPRLRGGGGRMPGQHPQGQTGAERKAARRRARGDAGRRRTGRCGRREPQDGDLRARSSAGDGARPRRAPATPQGRRPVRRHDLQGGRRAAVDRRGRPDLEPLHQGARRLARQPRRRRPRAPRPLPRQSANSAGPQKRHGKNGGDKNGGGEAK